MQRVGLNKPIERTSFLAKPKSGYLPMVFLGYLYFLFFIGRFPEFQQPVIWVLGPIVVFIVLISYLEKPFALPKEIYIYMVFWLWCLTGYLIAIDLGPFFRYFRLIFTILVLIICSEIVLMKSGSIKSVFKLYIIIGLSYFLYDIISGEFNASVLGEEGWRYAGLNSDSNWNAFMALTAVTGVCFFWQNSKKLLPRLTLIALLTIFLGKIVLSASRGGFITTLVFLGIWVIYANLTLFRRRKLVFLIIIIILLPLLTIAYDFLMANTFLGERFAHTISSEEEVTDEKRVQLYILAFEIFLDNPIVGIGLSQFLVMTNYMAFTHSEYMELLSTTGIVGFLLMMYFYGFILAKVFKLKRKIKSEVLLYRLNLFVAIIIATLVFGFFYANFINIMTMLQFSIIAGYTNYLENKLKDYNVYLTTKRFIKSAQISE